MNGTKTTDKKFIAESFCDYFTNVAIKLKNKSFLLRDLVWSNPSEIRLPQVKEKFLFTTVKDEEILTELRNLKRKKATGLDNLPPGFVKDAAGIIAKPLTFIINLSLLSGVVPTDRKWPRWFPSSSLVLWQKLATIDQYQFSLPCQRFKRKWCTNN